MMRCLLFFLCTLVLAHAPASGAAALGSALTYQGQLSDNGAPANGSYDVQFALYTSADGGSAVDTLDLAALAVSGGLVNASLDFTDVPYNGQALWIEMRVRPGGSSDSYTILTPRQTLSAAPYALHALSGNPGPTGPVGPSGAQGAAGPIGPQGPAGVVSLPYSGTASSSTPAFLVSNTANGDGLKGMANSDHSGVAGTNAGTGPGVYALSTSGPGVYGESVTNRAILATSQQNDGIYAESFGAGKSAIVGMNRGAGNGVFGQTDGGDAGGVFGFNPSGPGAWGRSTNNVGVLGQSTSGDGVQGATNSDHSGVAGINGGIGNGVYAYSESGHGIFAGSQVGSAAVYASAISGEGIHAESHHSNAIFGRTVDPSANSSGVAGYNIGAGPGVYGVGATGVGLLGVSNGNDGIQGQSLGAGKSAIAGIHLTGTAGNGVYGQASAPGYAVYAQGNFGASGSKNFVEPHPTDASKEIRYASLEGREVGTYFRGSGHLVHGEATIEVPDDFRLVTSADGLTVVATPIGELATIACMSKSLDRIVIRGSADVDFDYIVSGVRKAFTDFTPIHANVSFIPHSADEARDLADALPAESVRRMIANGTLNADRSVNAQTAHRLGWDQRVGWNMPKRSLESTASAPMAAQLEH